MVCLEVWIACDGDSDDSPVNSMAVCIWMKAAPCGAKGDSAEQWTLSVRGSVTFQGRKSK